MKRNVAVPAALSLILALFVLSTPSGAKPHGVRIHVSPASGAPRTTFLVRFRAPAGTGRFGSVVRRDQLTVSGPAGANGCVSTITIQVSAARAHAPVRVRLNPARYGGRWCKGTFRGRIDELRSPACTKVALCPLFASSERTLARFKFRVERAAGQTTSISFAGVRRASACTPGAQHPGETTPFYLSWPAAHDSGAPSSKLVYDIYMSTSSGAEDFSKPSWTTVPGATAYTTPGLPSHGTFYFVIRARDQAGHEDRNRTELRGLDSCY